MYILTIKCTSTFEIRFCVQVILLWLRAIFDPGFVRIFCLAHAERLSYQVCDAALRSLSELSQGRKGMILMCKLVNQFCVYTLADDVLVSLIYLPLYPLIPHIEQYKKILIDM